ncbi:type II toxin-antitoxin system HipA family toxin [Variovorax humicola]|uniref:Type II toxin-antitoxin system HipA family toxin n=1 Tax=Variovorax humicola TaxID=1769758 RepID=A0ABU8W0S3_9BURK
MAHPELDVWMNGEYVGAWYWTRTGVPALRYDDAWLRSPNVRALSLSLPIPAGTKELRGPAVESYFDNLLPDSDRIRERLRRRFRAASVEAADLLAAIGRDCVGAVQLLPAGQAPEPFDRIDSEPLTEAQVAQALRNVTADPVLGQTAGDEGDFRISIAGAQEKTALLRIGDGWHRPHGATPTTHILKLPLGLVGNMRANMSDSVENEWLCARVMAALGFEVARTEMGRFGDQKALVVERFDRRWMDNGRWIARLPQEDFCQATATPARLKYESDGGPGMQDCLSLLAASDDARADRRRFVLTQLAFWLLAATDGHAKNFSVFLKRGGGYAMTPLYDVLSAWPIIGKGASQVPFQKARLAMALRSKNVHYALAAIQARHWQALAMQSGVDDAFEKMLGLVRNAPEALLKVERELPATFPERVWRTVQAGVLAQCQRFESGLPRSPRSP